jgi:O-antigen/teichoic acid export membrane protein
MQPALTMGATQGLGILNYNFDSIMLGFLLGPAAVGLYNAAYRPVTAALAVPATGFIGLYAALSRAHAESPEFFRLLVSRSLAVSSIVALPLGICGTFFADPLIHLLFGPQYAAAVPVLQVLAWSAALVILRGTFRQALNAAGRQRLDLRCAGLAAALNVGLNVILIPRYGMMGAAAATIVSDVVWLALGMVYVKRDLTVGVPVSAWLRPFIASLALTLVLWVAAPLLWVWQVTLGATAYFATLIVLGESEIRSFARMIHDGLSRNRRSTAVESGAGL